MHQSLDAAASTTSSSSSPLAAFHAAVLDLAGLLERPLVPAGAEVHAHGAPASVAVKPHHSHHHHSAPSTSAASSGSSGSGGDDRRGSSCGSGSGGRSDDFEGLNFAQVCSPYKIRSQKKSQ